MILITAATAPVGRSIVEQLVVAARPVRALTRDPRNAGLPGAAEVRAGDLSDPASLAAAFNNVTAVFLLAAVPGFAPAFLEAAKAAGVRRIKFHGLRHTVATLMLSAGVPAHVVQRRLGHSKVEMTLGIYAHVLPSMQQDAAAKLAALLHGDLRA